MKGTVTAKSGSTVKLRQKPGTDCPIYWDIPVGTEMEIVDQRENWSKCICGGLTGWMKNEFIRTDGEEDLPIAPEPSVSEDLSSFIDPSSDPELEQALTLLADVYQTLQALCERIVGTIGRGRTDDFISMADDFGNPVPGGGALRLYPGPDVPEPGDQPGCAGDAAGPAAAGV